jgi:hypothetical protein
MLVKRHMLGNRQPFTTTPSRRDHIGDRTVTPPHQHPHRDVTTLLTTP